MLKKSEPTGFVQLSFLYAELESMFQKFWSSGLSQQPQPQADSLVSGKGYNILAPRDTGGRSRPMHQQQKFGCRKLSKTTPTCRDPAIEANAGAGGSRSGRLSVSQFWVEGDSSLAVWLRGGGCWRGPRKELPGHQGNVPT